MSRAQPERDPIPPQERRVVELFRGPLQGVRFPDLDRDVLELAELEVLEAQLAFEEAERSLEAARVELAARTAALSARCDRALAYARVYAQSDEALRAEVDALASPPRAPSPELPARKRGRPRKAAPLTPMFDTQGRLDEPRAGEESAAAS